MRETLKKSDCLVGIVKALRLLPRDIERCNARRRSGGLIAEYLAKHDDRGLQIGAGKNDIDGWLNTDINVRHDRQVYLNATDPFPLPENSFARIFSEHVIEHIPYAGGQAMLRECCRILKPGGTIRISTPNLINICSLVGCEPDAVKKQYIELASAKYVPENTGRLGAFVVNNFYWDFGHYFLYEPESMKFALEQAGFTNVRTCESGGSDVGGLSGLERHGDVVGPEIDAFETFITEADKPA